MTTFRTILQWLAEHDAAEDAEVWILSSNTVQPVTVLAPNLKGPDIYVASAPVWQEPPPRPLRFLAVYDTLMESYSGGGTLRWAAHSDTSYRGSYCVDPRSAVFLIFLPDSTRIVQSHSETLDERRRQAFDLTRKVEQWRDSLM